MPNNQFNISFANQINYIYNDRNLILIRKKRQKSANNANIMVFIDQIDVT